MKYKREAYNYWFSSNDDLNISIQNEMDSDIFSWTIYDKPSETLFEDPPRRLHALGVEYSLKDAKKKIRDWIKQCRTNSTDKQ